MTRENSKRILEIHGYHLGRPLSEVVDEVNNRLEKIEPQPGYQVTLVGEQEDFGEARSRIQSGLSPDQAVLEAVDIRFRPIMMTGLSNIAGMAPLAMEVAVGAERFSPIATVIIGGVITATVLTLIVVPALFAALDNLAGTIADKHKEQGFE